MKNDVFNTNFITKYKFEYYENLTVPTRSKVLNLNSTCVLD